MKYNDIITEVAPTKNIRNLVTNVILSLVSLGKSEVNTESLIKEIKQRTGIDVPYDTLMDIVMTIPLVSDANSDKITISDHDNESNDEQSSEEIVRDMAVRKARNNL